MMNKGIEELSDKNFDFLERKALSDYLKNLTFKLEAKRTWASIVFENTSINILQFCKDGILNVETIINDFSRRFIRSTKK